MRFSADSTSATFTVREYAAGEVRINDQVHRQAVLLSATLIRPLAELRRASALSTSHLDELLALEPQLVLVGTAHAHDVPDAKWRSRLLSSGIGVEVMNLGAACRTYNLLVAEQRKVAVILIP